MTLNELSPGQEGYICDIYCDENMKRRLLDMGLVNGTYVKCTGSNPGGNMHSFLIHDAVMAIRVSDCKNISVRMC